MKISMKKGIKKFIVDFVLEVIIGLCLALFGGVSYYGCFQDMHAQVHINKRFVKLILSLREFN